MSFERFNHKLSLKYRPLQKRKPLSYWSFRFCLFKCKKNVEFNGYYWYTFNETKFHYMKLM